MEYNDMSNENFESMFEAINLNSVKERQKDSKARVRANAYRRERIKKENFRKRVNTFIGLVTATTMITLSGISVAQTAKRDADLHRLVNEVVINDGKFYKSMVDDLMSEYNLSRDAAIYVVQSRYGEDAFNKLAVEYNFKDSEDFLYSRYFDKNNNNLIYSKNYAYRTFQNSVQSEIMNKLNNDKALNELQEEDRGISL